MKFIRYSKFNGFDVFGVDLGELMDALSDSDARFRLSRRLLVDAASETRPDDSIDALRQGDPEGAARTGNSERARRRENA